jgi:O-antigen/teichoic acid export membrane protein
MLGSATVKFYTEKVPALELRQIERSVGQLGAKISAFTIIIPILYYLLGLNRSYPHYELIAIAFVPLSFINLIPSVATWFCQAKQGFKQMLYVRAASQLSFMAFVFAGLFWDFSLNMVFLGYVVSWLVATLYVLLARLVRLSWIFNREKAFKAQILSYGKFTMTTLLGSNMLKNSDTYLIMGFLNEVSVARYNVPDRILGFIDMPIRAFTTADFPRFVALANQKLNAELQAAFNKGLGLAIVVVWPIALFVFVGAEELVTYIAGPNYRNSSLILRIFSIYGFLLPLDRYTGIMIDALGFPKMNMLKVVSMLILNVVLDAIVLSLGYGIEVVAIVSVATYSLGVVFGFTVIRKQVRLQVIKSISIGIQLLFLKITNKT